ncbi:hypothetical protein ABIB54_002313 [Frigoribacterium sp. UYMn621]
MKRWWGDAMVTSKKPSRNEFSPDENDAAAQPAADTAPFPESTALADTQPFPAIPALADTQPFPGIPALADTQPFPAPPALADTRPYTATPALADTQPFSFAQPYPEATQPLGVAEPRTPGDNPGVSGMTVPPFLRRHPLALGITAAALAVVVVAGLTAWGVGTAVADSYQTVGSAAVAPTVSHRPVAGARKVAVHTVVRGEIAGIAGASWTITTRAGATQHVTVGSATQYGTPKAPAAASDFVVSTAVVIVEKTSDGGKSAVRVVAAHAGGKTPGATATAGA